VLLTSYDARHFNGKASVALGLRGSSQQRTKDRIAIEMRDARPDDFGVGAHKRADAAVSDQCEIDGLFHRATVRGFARPTQVPQLEKAANAPATVC
jgi:hypothetical protein